MKQESTPSELPLSVSQPGAEDTLPHEKLERRRMMIRTISGSATLLAAASPLKSLASTSSCSTTPCSISGMQSANHSVRPGETTQQCGGYSPGWWGQQWKKDNNAPYRPWPTDYTQKVNTILIHSNISVSLFELMGNPTYSNTPERHWICAWLNALAFQQHIGPSGYTFAYTPQQVISFYLGTGPYPASVALNFFETYMENV